MSVLHNEMILASAGSGKTYQLTNRYIGLMAMQLLAERPVTPERIIAVTFTRKAAGEFFDSILEKLAQAAKNPDKAPKLDTDDAMARAVAELNREDYIQLLRIFISRMPRLFLGTLDSFYSNILRSFPAEFGLAGDFEILDPHLEDQARRDVYRSVFQRRFVPSGNDREEKGDPAQREFLEAFRQATFGKEESRIRRELDQFVSELHGIYLEAPDGNRWGQEEAIWPDGCPFLGEKSDLEKDFAELFEIFRASDDPDGGKDATVRVNWDYWNEFREEAPAHVPGAKLTNRISYMFRTLLPHWSDLKAGQVTISFNRKKHELGPRECVLLVRILQHLVGNEIEARLRRTQGVWHLLNRYESTYAERVRRQGRLTFQDLALLLAGVSTSDASATPLLSQIPGEDDRLRIDYRLDARYDHWLLDEFQDTSALQWKVIANLIDETVQDTSGERSLFQVGDIKQSIYSWRGGDPTLFRDIYRHYNQHEERIVRRDLDVSWRSGHDVIDPVNRIFGDRPVLENLPLPAEALDRWEWNDHRVCPPNESLAGYTALLNPIPPEGGKVEEEDRFDIVVQILEQMQPIQRGIECAILVQTNRVGRRLVDYIRAESDIPVMSEADVPIATDNALNRSILSLLQLGAHPGDRFSWEHLLLTPFRSVIEEEGWTRRQLSSRVRQHIFEEGFEQVIRHFLQELGEATELDEFNRRRGEDLALSARLFDRDGSRDIDEFLSFARNRTVREPDARSAVQVMTIHKSKGLTFDAVILPDLGGNSLTTARNDIGAKKGRNREIEWVFDLPRKEIYEADDTLRDYHAEREAEAAFENLCKLYVAMTRARCANYLITPPRPKRSNSNNFVKLLEDSLCAADPVEDQIGDCPVSLLFETDLPTTRRDWYEAYEIPEKESIEPEPLETLPVFLARERPQRRTPSGSEEAIISAEQIFNPLASEARELGTLVHELFEKIEWWTPKILDELEAASPSHPAVLEQVQNSLGSPEVQSALSRPSSNAIVWREKNFEIVLNGEWISGTFDRVVVEQSPDGKPESAVILDFKTDRVTPDRVTSQDGHAAAVAKYQPQLATYRAVLARLLQIPENQIETKLLFTRSARVVTVS
ncbi:MAG: UvrD-helicase domain-containing protein [Verrucomicrobiales bacterium]|nr:UvrD-helicase domain-containing protein [Verrucomicrobiales bacterium]